MIVKSCPLLNLLAPRTVHGGLTLWSLRDLFDSALIKAHQVMNNWKSGVVPQVGHYPSLAPRTENEWNLWLQAIWILFHLTFVVFVWLAHSPFTKESLFSDRVL